LSTRKFPIAIAATAEELHNVDELAKKLGMSRSDTIQYAVKKCVEEPEVLINMFKVIMEKPNFTEGKIEKKPTSTTLDEDALNGLETIASKLTMTRNTVLSVILRGIALGAV
jgi:biotin operon repressor